MDDSVLRKHIRKVISEFFNNAWVYTYGPNKFPNFDGTDPKTPSDIDAEAEELSSSDERLIEVPTFDGKKKGKSIYKILNKH
jgi:hypothetical protein